MQVMLSNNTFLQNNEDLRLLRNEFRATRGKLVCVQDHETREEPIPFNIERLEFHLSDAEDVSFFLITPF